MSRIVGLASAFVLSCIMLLGAWQSFAQLTSTGAGKKASGGAASFSGVFDVAACGSNCDYWGTRAASAADKGNRLMNVCNVADVACADLSSDATTGDLVISTIGGSSCSVITCTVKTLYGRGNGTFCNSYTTACDLTQATIATRPTLVVNCGGTGKPCLACNGSQSLSNATVSSFTQPLSFSMVAERTGNTSAYGDILRFNNAASLDVLYNNSANSLVLYAGSVSASVAGNDNVVHAVQALYNGASSTLRVDGTSSTVNPGTVGINTDSSICAGNPLTGNFFEAAAWNGDVSANFAAIYANQKAYWPGIP